MRVIVLALLLALQAVQSQAPPNVLPAAASEQLTASLAAARTHRQHLWRDTPPLDRAGRLTGVIEIPLGERRKYEFDIAANRMRLDRVMPPGLAYPVNYGFVPQTVSYDGDPFDVLVLGPPIPSGTIVHGVVVGLMHMEDEKGLDSKAVISPVDPSGRARFALTTADRQRIGRYFAIYKRHDPGKFSRVPGWGGVDAALAFVRQTHAFFSRGLHGAAPVHP